MLAKDVITALIVVTILGSNFVAIKVGLAELPPLLLTALRFTFAAFPAVLFVRPPKAPAPAVAAFGLTLGVVQFGLLFVAIRMGMPAGLSSLVIQMQVFFTLALAYAAFGEKPSRTQLSAGLLAACGIVVIAVHLTRTAPPLPFIMVLGAALAWAAANCLVKTLGRVDMLAVMVWGSAAAPIPLVLLSMLIEGPGAIATGMEHATWRSAVAIAYLAYPTTLFAFALWNGLLSRYPAATVAPFALLVPLVGMVSTGLMLGEPVDGPDIAGAVLVLIGLAWNMRTGLRGGRSRPETTALDAEGSPG